MDKRSIKNCFFCKRGDECIKEICLFAHTFEELNPTSCKWAGECKRRNCTYKHDHETKEEYAMRLFKYDMRRMGIFLPNIMNSEDVSSIQTIFSGAAVVFGYRFRLGRPDGVRGNPRRGSADRMVDLCCDRIVGLDLRHLLRDGRS